jgi:hypothetical protein
MQKKKKKKNRNMDFQQAIQIFDLKLGAQFMLGGFGSAGLFNSAKC